MTTILNIDQPTKWSESLKSTLSRLRPVMRAWELDLPEKDAVSKLSKALQHYSLRGWHCTRLTDSEVANIKANGLKVLSPDLVERRISDLIHQGMLQADVGDKLRVSHQASAKNRAGMVWFCFFHPREENESGIGRFLRQWGGEALYWAHEKNPAIAPILRQLGTPCIVEADVPVAWLSTGKLHTLAEFIAQRDLIHHGEKILVSRFEGYSLQSIPATYIREVHKFPDKHFIKLSGCNRWETPLS